MIQVSKCKKNGNAVDKNTLEKVNINMFKISPRSKISTEETKNKLTLPNLREVKQDTSMNELQIQNSVINISKTENNESSSLRFFNEELNKPGIIEDV